LVTWYNDPCSYSGTKQKVKQDDLVMVNEVQRD
jgi:hypothetical protein